MLSGLVTGVVLSVFWSRRRDFKVECKALDGEKLGEPEDSNATEKSRAPILAIQRTLM